MRTVCMYTCVCGPVQSRLIGDLSKSGSPYSQKSETFEDGNLLCILYSYTICVKSPQLLQGD